MVYFIQSEAGPIKIGYTEQHPYKRMKALQTSVSEKLTLLSYIDGDKNVEKNLHVKFSPDRIRGEWFNPSNALLDFIASNKIPKVDYVEKEIDECEIVLGNTIKTLRLFKNLNRIELCKKANVSMNALRHLEGGKGATVKTLIRVVKALDKQSWLDNLAPLVSINPLRVKRYGNYVPRQRALRKNLKKGEKHV